VFGIAIEICAACGGAVQIIASIEDPVVIRKILAQVGEVGAGSEGIAAAGAACSA
jgi:hypothetical protein